MRRRSVLSALFVVLAAGTLATSAAAGTITIASWDAANQRGGDLAVGGQYSDFRGQLLAHGDTVLPGLSTLTAAALGGLDAFFWGTSSHVLSAAEGADLLSWVSTGGLLVVETNSATSEQAGANSAYSALGLGNPVGNTGNGAQTANSGAFTPAITATTLGEFGDIRGGTFGSSIARIIDPTGAISVGVWGTTIPRTTWVEFDVGSGRILGLGDPYGFNLFSSGSLANPNNLTGYMNFLHQRAVPEPSTLLLIGMGLTGLLISRRRSS